MAEGYAAVAGAGRSAHLLPAAAGHFLDKQVRYLRPGRHHRRGCGPDLADYCRQEIIPKLPMPASVNEPLGNEATLLVTARALMQGGLNLPESESVDVGPDGTLTTAVVRRPGLGASDALEQTTAWQRLLADLPRIKTPLRTAGYLWDLLSWNPGTRPLEDSPAAPNPYASWPAPIT